MSRIRSSPGWPEFFAVIITADRESTFSLNGSTVLHQSLIQFALSLRHSTSSWKPIRKDAGLHERWRASPAPSILAGDSNPDPLIKSQSQRTKTETLTRKSNHFWERLLFLRHWKVYVLPRFRHKTSTGGSPLGSASQKLTVALAEKHRLPAIYARRPVVEDLADTQ